MVENVEGVERQRELARFVALRLRERYVMGPMHVDRGEAGRPQRIAADANRTRVGHAGVEEIDAGGFGVRHTRGEACGHSEVAPTAGGKGGEYVQTMADVEIGRSPFGAEG